MKIVDRILKRQEFQVSPPVLFDVGASGGLSPEWGPLARYSICVACDADNREIAAVENKRGKYRQFHVLNKVVNDDAETQNVKFHYTRSPYCSSVLEPDTESLKQWAFADLFAVERTADVESVHIGAALRELTLDRIDWFKTDSQGIDLRLFAALQEHMRRKVIIAEFEPGIMSAYIGEDKLSSVLQFMENEKFWMCDMRMQGTQRIFYDIYRAEFSEKERRFLPHVLSIAPGWANVSYFNTFEGEKDFTLRDYLLGYTIAVMRSQYGFALELSRRAQLLYSDSIFDELAEHALRKIKSRVNLLSISRIYWDRLRNKLERMFS